MNNKTFTTLHALSRQLGLPAAWIKTEANAGRLPCLRTNRRLMFNLVDIESILIQRAKDGTSPTTSKSKEVDHASTR